MVFRFNSVTIKPFVFALVCLLMAGFSNAQDRALRSPFAGTIRAFRMQDSIQPLPAHVILFAGSSSFTNWHSVQQMFPDHTIINRGFGGSQLPDLMEYFKVVMYPPDVKQIVIYAGDNDIASGATARSVLQRFKSLFQLLRKDLPHVQLTYLSIKGCPGRSASIPVVQEANRLISRFISHKKCADFVDIYHATMDAQGKPMNDIYVEDGVHMNQKGYAIWASVLRPYLKK